MEIVRADGARFYERYGMRPYLHVLLGAVPGD
jgi:hypothetical protein